MSTDLDQRLAATLRAHAGGETDPAPIVERARQRGRRIKIRRRGGVIGAAVAVVSAAALLWQPATAPVPKPDGILAPAATGESGAATRPDLVGADPWTLHFDPGALVAGARHVEWTAGSGIEDVKYWGPAGSGRLLLTRDADRLDSIKQVLSSSAIEFEKHPVNVRIGGRTGTVWSEPNTPAEDLWFVRWQPIDGVWARLETYAMDGADAADLAGRVRFDSARRCTVPFELTELPAGSSITSCSVTLAASSERFSEGTLVVGDGKRWLVVRAERTPVDDEPVVSVDVDGIGNGYTESDGRTVRDGYRRVGDLDDLSEWPD
ncbi:hypothetical protein AB0M02_23105 [Actinoplanes sp. NPDC051861]|uniref:hypothetical protein n=1 Tax=Actinoplanes sp. NPDC051861 TaxID=3155170 RepID=UPI0034131EE3